MRKVIRQQKYDLNWERKDTLVNSVKIKTKMTIKTMLPVQLEIIFDESLRANIVAIILIFVLFRMIKFGVPIYCKICCV